MCFFFSTKDDCFSVNIQPPVGELLLPVAMSEKDFKKEQDERDYCDYFSKQSLQSPCSMLILTVHIET